jgi:glycosyltransferase involved in cell wall biosynthesis
MRLLFVCKTYQPVFGGIERHVATLAAALAAEHEITVLTMRITPRPDSPLDGNLWPAPRFAPFERDGVRVEQLRCRPRWSPRYLPFAVRVLPYVRRSLYRKGRLALIPLWIPALRRAIEPHAAAADLIHVFGDEFLALAGVEAARAVGRPAVVNGFVHPRAWGDDLVSRRAYLAADRVVANRDEDARCYLELGVPPGRLRIGGEGVPAPVSPGRRPRHPDYRDGVHYVLYVGRRQAYKGFRLMVEAAAWLAAYRPDVRVVFIGPGPRLPEGTPGTVDVGPVPDDERDAWLARADLLCLPSAHETYGLCLLEAWANRVPVVVSDIPVLTALLRESGGGVAVPRDAGALTAAIGSLLDDPDRRRRLGEAGHAFWRAQAAPQAYARRHVAVYAELLPATAGEPRR